MGAFAAFDDRPHILAGVPVWLPKRRCGRDAICPMVYLWHYRMAVSIGSVFLCEQQFFGIQLSDSEGKIQHKYTAVGENIFQLLYPYFFLYHCAGDLSAVRIFFWMYAASGCILHACGNDLCICAVPDYVLGHGVFQGFESGHRDLFDDRDVGNADCMEYGDVSCQSAAGSEAESYLLSGGRIQGCLIGQTLVLGKAGSGYLFLDINGCDFFCRSIHLYKAETLFCRYSLKLQWSVLGKGRAKVE